MSVTTAPIDRAHALAVVEWLLCRCQLTAMEIEGATPSSVGVVGSLRRGRQAIGDIDLIAPMPTDANRDGLRFRIDCCFAPAKPPAPAKPTTGDLFATPPPPTDEASIARVFRGVPLAGRVLQGGSPMFRRVSLELTAGPAIGQKVEIHRFDPGPNGNRGWIELIRTGPAEFAQAIVTRWQHVRGRPFERGSVEGYPLDMGGSKLPVKDEEAAFRLVGLGFIPPNEREDAVQRVLAMTRRDYGTRSLM